MSINNQVLHEIDRKNYLPTFNRFPLAFIKGSGSRLWDADGKEYIDMLAGIAVNSVGHCHPKIVAAIQEQASQLMHISNFFVSPPQVALSELLVKISGLDKVFLTNSGAESVEGAIKIARKYAHDNGHGGDIISMQNSFHGRTMATIATGQAKYQKGFEPIPSGFRQVPFNDLDAVKNSMDTNTAAVIVEPIQGEGGIVVADKAYLKGLRDLCDQKGILLIFDEVQCGIGRTGYWFAKEYFGVQPDIMTLAKGLGGGVPIGAVLCSEQVSAAIEFGDHGTTFGGNPLCAAAALANLQIISEEKLCEAAIEKGEMLKSAFLQLQKNYPTIQEIRGLGLMLGVRFDQPTAPLVKILMEKGIIANATANNILRLVPPLNISQGDLEVFMRIMEEVLENETKIATIK